MGFFFGLVGYLTAIALMVGGAVGAAAWVTRGKPVALEQVGQVSDPAKRMRNAPAALTRQPGGAKHASRRRKPAPKFSKR
jgi:hypothetical protein